MMWGLILILLFLSLKENWILPKLDIFVIKRKLNSTHSRAFKPQKNVAILLFDVRINAFIGFLSLFN